jgi:hypothetical protein
MSILFQYIFDFNTGRYGKLPSIGSMRLNITLRRCCDFLWNGFFVITSNSQLKFGYIEDNNSGSELPVTLSNPSPPSSCISLVATRFQSPNSFIPSSFPAHSRNFLLFLSSLQMCLGALENFHGNHSYSGNTVESKFTGESPCLEISPLPPTAQKS